MNLQPMKPTPYTSAGNTFYVFCVSCGAPTRSDKVLCDTDDKVGTFYCPECADEIRKEGSCEGS